MYLTLHCLIQSYIIQNKWLYMIFKILYRISLCLFYQPLCSHNSYCYKLYFTINFFSCFFFKFYFIFKLYIILLVLPNIKMNPPQVYMCSPSWTLLPPPSPYKWNHSVVSDSLQPHGLQPTRLLCPWDSPGKNTGVGCHFLKLSECEGEKYSIFIFKNINPQSSKWSKVFSVPKRVH